MLGPFLFIIVHALIQLLGASRLSHLFKTAMYSSRQIDQPSQLSQHVSAEATVSSTHPQHYCMPGSQTVFNSVAVPPSPSFSLSPEVQPIPAHHSYPPSFCPSGSPCLSDSPHMIHYGISSPIIGSYPESQSSPRVSSRAGDSHVIVHHWGPVQGISGSQIIVKCDTETAFLSRPGRSVTPSAGGPGQMTKTLRVVFGSYPVLTKVENLKENIDRNTSFLRVTVPDWSLTGAASDDTGGGGIVLVSLQILADDINILETVPLGHFIYTEGEQKGFMFIVVDLPDFRQESPRNVMWIISSRQNTLLRFLPFSAAQRQALSRFQNFNLTPRHNT